MTPEEKKLLEEVTVLTRENHQILKRMQRARHWGRFFWFLKWLIVIGVTVWLYYYLQPIINQLFATYQSLVSGVEGISKTGPVGDISKFLEWLKGGGG
jgi:uncharacterized protein involved in cysteine biosynthesis